MASWEIKNVNASQPEILGDLIMQKFVESKSQIYTFLLCGECLQIPPSNNYQYVCEQGHVMCESCGYKTAACAFVYSGNKCDRKISRVKITIAQQQLSNCFLSDDTPGKEICEVTIPSPSVVESEKLVLPDATTQQPNTDDVISKTVSTNEIVAVNPPIKLDEKLSDDIHAITNPAIVEAIGLPDNAPSTVMLKPISTEPATQMDTMEENSTCDFSPKSCSSSPKLETDMQKTIDMEKDEESPQKIEESPQELAPQKLEASESPQKLEASESPQKLEELPQQLKKLPQKLEESESSQKLGETFQVEQTQPLAAKFYHLKRLSKYFTKEELADVKEWVSKIHMPSK